jgi:hypothetical protein
MATPRRMTHLLQDAAHHAYMDSVKTRMFVLGLSSGSTLTLFCVSILVMMFSYDPASGGIHEICGWPYPLFRSSFLLCLCGLLYGGTLFAWRRCKVDYRSALDVSPFVTYDTVLAYAYACFIAVFSAFLVYALLLMAPGALGADVSAFRDALPALAFLAPALFLAWPADRAPLSLAASPGAVAARRGLVFDLLLPVLAGPFRRATFARTFVADVLCSMPKIFADMQYATCALGAWLVDPAGDTLRAAPATCGPGLAYARVAVLLQVGPFLIRLGQSARAFRDDPAGRRKNAANAAKYLLAVALVAASVLKKGSPGDAFYARAWLALALASTLCNFLWDVFMDWGLGRGRPKKFPAPFYAVAVGTNFAARLGWAVYVSPDQTLVAQHVILLLGVVEVARRFQWALIRVEHEHVKLHPGEDDAGLRFSQHTP